MHVRQARHHTRQCLLVWHFWHQGGVCGSLRSVKGRPLHVHAHEHAYMLTQMQHLQDVVGSCMQVCAIGHLCVPNSCGCYQLAML